MSEGTTTEPELTEEQFVARCRTIYRMGLATHAHMRVLERWCDMVARFEAGQIDIYFSRLQEERERTDAFSRMYHGANDAVGYGVIKLAAVLVHPCQICAEDENAWHCRVGFCEHQGNIVAALEAKPVVSPVVSPPRTAGKP